MNHLLILLLIGSMIMSCDTKETGIYPHLIYHPESYTENPDSNHALMIFLHGAGERGTNLDLIKKHGAPKQIEAGMSMPCIVLAPQCPEGVWWDLDRLQTLLDTVLVQNNIDRSRIYLTGLSMGGYATWHWSCEKPDQFAAIIPICGGGDPDDASAIKNLPVWAFHGAKDNVVPLSESQDMVDALAELDNKVKFTVYPDANHDSWTETYDDPRVYEWLWSQQKQ